MKRLLSDLTAGLAAVFFFAAITIAIIGSSSPGQYLPFYIALQLFIFLFFGVHGAGLIAALASTTALGVLIIAGCGSAVLAVGSFWACLIILNTYNSQVSGETGSWNLQIENIEKEIGGVEVENKRLGEMIASMKERMERYNSLAEFAIRLSTTLEYDKLFTYIKKFIVEIFHNKNVMMLTEPRDKYDRWVYEKKQPLLVENTVTDYRFDRSDRSGFSSLMAGPVLMGGRVTGVIRVESSKARFTSPDMRLLNTVCTLSSIALENIRLFMKTQELAIRDGLTGLYTQTYFKERLQEEVERAARYRETFSVVMMDLDNFKMFNDTYGHKAGDEVLRKVAAVVQETIRETDIAGRYGGEEMCVILRNIAPPEAEAIAQRIRMSVEACRFDFVTGGCSITASLGMSVFPGSVTADELLRSADNALYQSKRSGRNRVTVDEQAV